MIEINGQEFKTKDKLTRYVRDILNTATLGESLPIASNLFIQSLFTRHPEYTKKRGSGVLDVKVVTDNVWGKTRHFVIHRTDGSTTDFSYLKCISGKKDPLKDFKAACREAVAQDIISFRSEFQQDKILYSCPVLGIEMTSKTSHVDHHPQSFNSLVDEFIFEYNLIPQDVEISGTGDNEIRRKFKDEHLRQLFLTFHFRKATLRVISTKANLSKKRD